jgi:hypothetical protein
MDAIPVGRLRPPGRDVNRQRPPNEPYIGETADCPFSIRGSADKALSGDAMEHHILAVHDLSYPKGLELLARLG